MMLHDFDGNYIGPEGEPECEKCGGDLDWIACDVCGGSGDYGDDTDPEDLEWHNDPDYTEPCATCDRAGGWYVCYHCNETEKTPGASSAEGES